jgi:hypothetical protein
MLVAVLCLLALGYSPAQPPAPASAPTPAGSNEPDYKALARDAWAQIDKLKAHIGLLKRVDENNSIAVMLYVQRRGTDVEQMNRIVTLLNGGKAPTPSELLQCYTKSVEIELNERMAYWGFLDFLIAKREKEKEEAQEKEKQKK